MNRKVIIDAGHGGIDPGAVYQGRMEKADNLQLAFDLGNALMRRGIAVEYTRVEDVYDTPLRKAEIANESDADYLVSIHRNAMPVPGSASGYETLIFGKGGTAELLASNINREMEKTGFRNLGIRERPNLAILRRTAMPAVIVEAGFLDNEEDNERFDREIALIADSIADGVLRTMEMELYQTEPE